MQLMDSPRNQQRTFEQTDTIHNSGNRLRLTRRGRGVLAVLGTAGMAGLIAFLAPEGASPADYSQQKEIVQVEPGQGLLDVAHHVEGSDHVDIRDVTEYIKEMPENTEALKDGLQAGEHVTIPVSVKHG